MPFKHQAESFRTRNGKRFLNDGDICEGDVKAAAKARVQQLRAEGFEAFSEYHPDGYCRVFTTKYGDRAHA